MPKARKRGKAGALDDAVMTIIAQAMLSDPNACPEPDTWRAMLERFLELLEQEAARRPPHRPKGDEAGMMVELLIERGWPQADARQRVALALRKTRDAVARAHNRHRREAGQK
jgi:hypothetical protein